MTTPEPLICGASSRSGSAASASMVTWAMSPTTLAMMNEARLPISADLKRKMDTPTATPTTSSAACVWLAVR